jgi:surfactin synthase thioesterase subunit
MKAINLFCLPYAGGDKYSYRKFEEVSPEFLRIMTLEYPGRGSRLDEPAITDMYSLCDCLYRRIKDIAESGEYAIYGHSMGAVIACLLARKLISLNHPQPLHVFVSGTGGPSDCSRNEKKRHLMGKRELIRELVELDGISKEISESEDFWNYFEPIVRADFAAIENYVYKEELPLAVPFTVITGLEEGMTSEEIQLWQKETTYAVDFRTMPGKHFFIFKSFRQIVEIISKKLLKHSKMEQI